MVEKKLSYDNITIPDNLSEVLVEAKEKYKRHQIRTNIMKYGTTIAACIALIILSNVPSAYASLHNMPIIGTVVKVLHFGNGGVITDGVSVHNESIDNNLKIWFDKENRLVENSPYFNVEKRVAPNRIDISFSGVRNFDMKEFIENAKAIEYVKDAYQVVILDDSMFKVVIELKDNVDYQLKEYKDPGYLEITFDKINSNISNAPIYFIRSKSMEMGEELAYMAELYFEEDTSIVKTNDGKYTMVIGEFTSLEKAENKLKEIKDKELADTELYVESCINGGNPK